MQHTVFVAPHEREEAIEAYRELLSAGNVNALRTAEPDLMLAIQFLPDGNAVVIGKSE